MDGRRAHDTDVIVTLFNCEYLADPIIQADPQVQQGNNSQNLNRYSYVLNNPLRYTDPSGYNFLDVAAKWMPTIMAVVVSISPAGPIAGGALAGWVGSSFTLKGAAIGALSGAIFAGVGDAFVGSEGFFTTGGGGHILTHGVVGGVLSVIQGSQFGHGFLSAGFTKLAMTQADFNYDDISATAITERTMIATLIGGTSSKISGGKFANGATTAAMAHLFNAEAEHFRRGKLAHKLLQDYLKKRDVGKWEDEVLVKSTKNPTKRGFLDLKHKETGSAYEIKPRNTAGIESGVSQLEDYVSANHELVHGDSHHVMRGNTHITLYGMEGMTNYKITYTALDVPAGLIVYDHSKHMDVLYEVVSSTVSFSKLFNMKKRAEILTPNTAN